MTFLRRFTAALLAGAMAAVFAAGLYAESHRAPDQP
jgi:hypothetical protein